MVMAESRPRFLSMLMLMGFHLGKYSVSSFKAMPWHQHQRLPSASHYLAVRNRVPVALGSRTAVSDSKVLEEDSTSFELSTIWLKRNRQSKAFRSGNPLIFTKAIDRVEASVAETSSAKKDVPAGSLVHVVVPSAPSKDGSVPPPVSLGYGVYNPNSMYRVRFLCHKTLQPSLYRSIQQHQKKGEVMDEKELIQGILDYHLKVAIGARRVLQLPSNTIDDDDSGSIRTKETTVTDTYRLLHGEGDGVSGLALDVIANQVAVIMSSAAWCQVNKDIIISAVQRALPEHEVVWKTTPSRLRQDGWEPDDKEDEEHPKSDVQVYSRENGISYITFPYAIGQKTGVYCDQRDNRKHLARFCDSKRVLDLCCYHGGFSLNAIQNGNAATATGVDSSQDAIDASMANAIQNDCHERTDFIRDDITNFMQSNFGKREYDVVVLDPPKLSPSAKDLPKATRKYHGLNRDAIKLVSREHGGLLVTCTCSASMTQKDGGQYFLNMVHAAALAAGRTVSLLEVRGAAPCHVQSAIAWPAGAYLTAAFFHVHPAPDAQ